IKKQFESEEASPKNVLGNVFSNIMKMSPLYYLGWKASQTKNKLSNTPPMTKVETKIGEWFDKIGAILQHASSNIGSGSALASTASDFDTDGEDEDEGSITASDKDSSSSTMAAQYKVDALNLKWANSYNRAGAGYHPEGSATYAAITNNTNGGRHFGVDFSYGDGETLKTPTSGIVLSANFSQYGFGYMVKIYDGQYTHGFAHMSRVSVRKGQKVKAGQVIGAAGNTGNSFGAHLHWQVWKGKYMGEDNSGTIDPEAWLKMANGGKDVKIQNFNGGSSSSNVDAANSNNSGVSSSSSAVDMGPLNFDEVDWRGTITDRDKPYKERTKEESEALFDRMAENWSKSFGVSLDEIKKA